MPKAKIFERRVYKGRGAWGIIKVMVCDSGEVYHRRQNFWVQVNHALGDPACVLVLKTFGGPKPSPKHECCHKDDNRSNNAITNLYWGTHAQNMADAARNGKAYCPIKKQTDELVSRAVELYNSGLTVGDVAKELGVGYGTAHRWLDGKVERREGNSYAPGKCIAKYGNVIDEIRQKYTTGKYSRDELCKEYGLSTKVVWRITMDINLPRHRSRR